MTEAARVLGNRVKQLRRERGLSAAALGDAVGISDEWVRRIERGTGKPSLETIEALAENLDTHVATLFTGDDAAGRFERLRSLTHSLSDEEMSWLLEIGDLILRRPKPLSTPTND